MDHGIDLTYERGLHTQHLRLRQEFADTLGEETIARHYGDAVASFAGARIRTYVPIFAFRRARARLLDLRDTRTVVRAERLLVAS
jgi:hypothetical protein